MSVYYDNARAEVKEYFRILEPEFPEWLNEYIDTREMLKQQYISPTCGTLYTDLLDSEFFYSNLDHSVGVALVIWHFTHDKKQTLAGLFHDIATPAFKHCVDFMNGDYLTQESTEDLTSKIITDSPEIRRLLKRDGIRVSEVDDYHIYPIADNNTPKLSADRLEYSLAHALFTYRKAKLPTIRRIYRDITVLEDPNGVLELGFQTEKIAEEFVNLTNKLSVIYMADQTRYSMQFLADVLRGLDQVGKISVKDLYLMGDAEVMEVIRKSEYREALEKWRVAKGVKTGAEKPEGVYAVKIAAKVRYIDPLVAFSGDGSAVLSAENGADSNDGSAVQNAEKQGYADESPCSRRISEICPAVAEEMRKILAYNMGNYVWVDGVNL